MLVLLIVKHIPEWVPGFHFKRLARQWAKDVEELRWAPFVSTKSQLVRPPAHSILERYRTVW